MCDFGLVKGLMIKEVSFGRHRVSRDGEAKDLFKAKKKVTLPGTVKDSLFARNAASQRQRFQRRETTE